MNIQLVQFSTLYGPILNLLFLCLGFQTSSFKSGRTQNKSKMARVEQQCASESSTDSPYYLQLSYFTIYLTKGIEILEYYTRVSGSFQCFDSF